MLVVGKPGAINDWHFSWETDHSTDPALDLVTFKQDTGRSCSVEILETTISRTTGGVIHSVTPIDGGRYLHELTWLDRPCDAGCKIQYKVKSGTATGNHGTGWKEVLVSVCVY